MEKGKSSTLGSVRCRFKRLRRVETGNAANVGLRCSVLNGENADVPEDIGGLVAALPAVCNGYTHESHFQCGRYSAMHCRGCVFRRAHVI